MSLEGLQARRLIRIPEALHYAAISRSRFYEWARARPKLVRKNGRASLVDLEELNRILDGLPSAYPKADDAA